jgi:hypothetical protein
MVRAVPAPKIAGISARPSSALADELNDVIGLVPLIGPYGPVRQQEPASLAAAQLCADIRRQEIDRPSVMFDLAGSL